MKNSVFSYLFFFYLVPLWENWSYRRPLELFICWSCSRLGLSSKQNPSMPSVKTWLGQAIDQRSGGAGSVSAAADAELVVGALLALLQRPLQCPLCSFAAASTAQLGVHLQGHRVAAPTGPVASSGPMTPVRSTAQLGAHLHGHCVAPPADPATPSEPTTSSDRKFPCTQCSKSFKGLSFLVRPFLFTFPA